MRRAVAGLATFSLAASLLGACGGGGQPEATTTTISTKATSRAVEACQLRAAASVAHQGRVTIATATPAFEPWFFGNDPANGLGFESGLAYDLSAKLGFKASEVRWVALPFAAILAKGKRPFDLALSEIPGDVAHARSTELSKAYWPNPLALVVRRGSKLTEVPWSDPSTQNQTDGALASATLGVVGGSTSARYARDTIKPSVIKRYPDLDAAARALRRGKVDGVVAALPDAWLMARNQPGARVLGSFVGSGQGLVVAVARGGIPVECVNRAISALAREGTTKDLAKRYLSIFKR